MNDILAFVLVAVAFAVAATAHLAIAHGLVRRRPRWHALVALFVLPLAPYWAIRERMPVRAGVWIVGALGYVVARTLHVV